MANLEDLCKQLFEVVKVKPGHLSCTMEPRRKLDDGKEVFAILRPTMGSTEVLCEVVLVDDDSETSGDVIIKKARNDKFLDKVACNIKKEGVDAISALIVKLGGFSAQSAYQTGLQSLKEDLEKLKHDKANHEARIKAAQRELDTHQKQLDKTHLLIGKVEGQLSCYAKSSGGKFAP
eukprot:CAMPEP_0118932272 /NCGR_PEP_ID=MMETSP1169-20130426/9700_1 /TAXON_ID=36882 /ORGANISM="Pyramimonas obovata, Strain CCMP722" /LENGTH=176 /DNA_ID=CAMNT_0006874905 /DNA_START=74 /DNA_END=604 /DNA_ORIENTATION=+